MRMSSEKIRPLRLRTHKERTRSENRTYHLIYDQLEKMQIL